MSEEDVVNCKRIPLLFWGKVFHLRGIGLLGKFRDLSFAVVGPFCLS